MEQKAWIIDEKTAKQYLTVEDAIDCVEKTWKWYGEGRVIMPNKITTDMSELGVAGWFNSMPAYIGGDGYPKVMQDGKDGDEYDGYVGNIQNSATAGFKYFDIQNVSSITITARGYASGVFEVRTKWDGPVLAELPIAYTNVWEDYTAPITIEDGVHAIYLTFRGQGNCHLKSFELK